MARKKRATMWVIFAKPEQRGGGPGNLFIAHDGTKTESPNHAATFHTFESAQAFATKKGITLDGAMTYIGQFTFTE